MTPPTLSRERILSVRVSNEEFEAATRMADEDGITVSDVVRMVLRREYARRYDERIRPAKRVTKRGQ